jgi:hypothetical protein
MYAFNQQSERQQLATSYVRVVELVDTRDLKSLATHTGVRVRFPSRAQKHNTARCYVFVSSTIFTPRRTPTQTQHQTTTQTTENTLKTKWCSGTKRESTHTARCYVFVSSTIFTPRRTPIQAQHQTTTQTTRKHSKGKMVLWHKARNEILWHPALSGKVTLPFSLMKRVVLPFLLEHALKKHVMCRV